MQLFHCLILFCLGSFPSRVFAATSCYRPNGTDVNAVYRAQFLKPVYEPCNAGDEHSMCCAMQRNIPDKCRSDGLCLNEFKNLVWRDSCTDPTWKSPHCVKLCTQGSWYYRNETKIEDRAGTDTTVTPCDDGSFCCGNGTIAQACCDKKEGVFIVNGETSKNSSGIAPPVDLPLNQSTSKSTQSPPSPSNTTTPLTSETNQTHAVPIVIIVGTLIGTALVLAIGALLIVLRNSRRKSHQPKAAVGLVQSEELAGDEDRKEMDGRREFELDTGSQSCHEMGS